jgi:cob(I)alamin adenosyltransferase
MSQEKLSQIKARLAQGTDALTRKEVEWLVKRVEELEKENEWLRSELAYSENQGEISF